MRNFMVALFLTVAMSAMPLGMTASAHEGGGGGHEHGGGGGWHGGHEGGHGGWHGGHEGWHGHEGGHWHGGHGGWRGGAWYPSCWINGVWVCD